MRRKLRPPVHQPKCPFCGSTLTLYRQWSDSYRCLFCAYPFRFNTKTGKALPYRLLRLR